MVSKDSHPGLLQSVFSNKCPHCRQGNLFVNPNPYDLNSTMKMPECCPECGQKFELQTGFYFGTGYVSYFFTIVLSCLSCLIWWLTIGIGLRDNRIWWWLTMNAALLILLQPIIQRLARSIWIAFFVKYDARWKNEGMIA